jgi:hypothetical protein
MPHTQEASILGVKRGKKEFFFSRAAFWAFEEAKEEEEQRRHVLARVFCLKCRPEPEPRKTFHHEENYY